MLAGLITLASLSCFAGGATPESGDSGRRNEGEATGETGNRPPPAPALAAVSQTALPPDLFGPLRHASGRQTRREPNWARLAEDLRRLKSLHGAGVDPATGQLVLFGELSRARGPFLLEDLLVAIRAAFFEMEVPGMTIDENPNDKHGPTMHVRYFGGTSNTHLGLVMFEVDRLMKSFGQGTDNLTRQPVRPRFEGFATHAEISHALGDSGAESNWSRFWANLTTGRFPSNDLRGKVVVEQSRDGQTISFLQHRIWIDTEQMYDPGPGRRLVSSGGVRSPSAERFADLLTGTFEKIAAEFPVFGELQELSKLVVLAEWLRESGIPFDLELLYCQVASRTTTPTTTPSLSTTNWWTNGLTIHSISMLGGVNLDGTPRYGTPVDPGKKKADSFADAATQHRAELREGRTVESAARDGAPQGLIPVGPNARGPPYAPPDFRQPSRFMEVRGRHQPVSRELDDPVLGKYELPLRTHAATGRDMLDMPILRAYFSPRQRRTVTFTDGSGIKTEVQIPDHLYLTSPSRQIAIQFETRPQFDAARREAYFPARQAPGIKGYYPASRTVRLENGMEYQFDDAGLPAGVRGADLPTLTITHRAYQDGPCIQTPATPATMPRAPPRAGLEVRSRAPVVSRELDADDGGAAFQPTAPAASDAGLPAPALVSRPAVGRDIAAPSALADAANRARGPPAEPARVMEARARPPLDSRELDETKSDTATRAVFQNAGTGRSMEVRDCDGRLFLLMK